MTTGEMFRPSLIISCILGILITACAGTNQLQQPISETPTKSLEPVVTGLARRSIYVPQGIDKSGTQVNLERAWTAEDRLVLEFILRGPSWIEVDDQGKLAVQENAVLGDELVLSNLSSRDVLESKQDYEFGGRIRWTLQLSAPADPEQMVKLVFGDFPILQVRDDGQLVPVEVFEGPWEFGFRPMEAVNLPTRQLLVDEIRTSDSFVITVEDAVLSSESTEITFRIDPGFPEADWELLGPVAIQVGDQSLSEQQPMNEAGRFTYRFPAVPPDTRTFSLAFPPFQVSEPESVNLTLDLSIAAQGWQTLELDGERLNFRVDPGESSFAVRYSPADTAAHQTLITGPGLSLSARDDLGNSYTFVDQELRLGSNQFLLEHRLISQSTLNDQAGELILRSDRKGRITEPIRFLIRLVEMEEKEVDEIQ